MAGFSEITEKLIKNKIDFWVSYEDDAKES